MNIMLTILFVLVGVTLGFAIYALQVHRYRKRRRNNHPKSILDKMEKWRASQFKNNETKCENYSPDNSKVGVSCIFPWCDYCSFNCPRGDCNG